MKKYQPKTSLNNNTSNINNEYDKFLKRLGLKTKMGDNLSVVTENFNDWSTARSLNNTQPSLLSSFFYSKK